MENQSTVAYYTQGCKLNFSETSTISRQLTKEGYQKVDFKEVADIYVINTCSVTENADKECKRLVRSALKTSPDAFIVVVGCYAQLKPEKRKIFENILCERVLHQNNDSKSYINSKLLIYSRIIKAMSMSLILKLFWTFKIS